MKSNIYIFFGWYLAIFFHQCDLGNALFGPNVRVSEEQEFPSVVSLIKLNHDETDEVEINHFCTGSLISNRDVLTAEHCLVDKNLLDIRVVAGSVNLRLGRRFTVAHWLSYNDWTELRYVRLEFPKNDIAVVRLIENVPDEIVPTSISTLSTIDVYGYEVVLAGWGSITNLQKPLMMETASLKLLTNRECEKRVKRIHGKMIPFHVRVLCSFGVPSAVLTYGDSGGPLFHNGTIVGVNLGTCLYRGQPDHPGKINLHSGTDYYRNFIIDYMNNF